MSNNKTLSEEEKALKEARENYSRLTGKRAGPKWGLEKIREKTREASEASLANLEKNKEKTSEELKKPQEVSPKPLSNNIFVHLRVYAGITLENKPRSIISKDENGKILNTNQLVKLKFNTLEWKNYLKQLPKSQWFKTVVEKVFDGNQLMGYVPVQIQKSIDDAYGVAHVAEKEQKR